MMHGCPGYDAGFSLEPVTAGFITWLQCDGIQGRFSCGYVTSPGRKSISKGLDGCGASNRVKTSPTNLLHKLQQSEVVRCSAVQQSYSTVK